MKLEQAPRVQNGSRFNQTCVCRQHGLVGPIARNRQTAFFLVVKTRYPGGRRFSPFVFDFKYKWNRGGNCRGKERRGKRSRS